MRLLVGLGNPGKEHTDDRHTIGFVALDAVLKQFQIESGKQFAGGELFEVRLAGEKHLLFKPLQFMNRSGGPIQEVMRYFDIESTNLCILSDEVYVAPGSIRIRKGGGDGGHNGWKSVIEQVKPDEFWRVKIGVGIYEQSPEKRMHQPPLDHYVLQTMPAHDQKLTEKAIDKLVSNLVQWLELGQMEEATIHLQ